jgi:hypothetical protein
VGQSKPKRAKPQTSISLSPELWAEVDALAKANLRTRAAQIEWLVRRGIEAEKKVRKKLPETP